MLLPAGMAMVSAIAFMSSCNSKSDDAYGEDASSSVAVTNFCLKASPLIMDNIDSVFFSIDLRNQIIFNPDSLPKGTRIDALIPVITYPSTVSGAVISMSGGTKKEGDIDYKNNPADSIDFTGNVTLTLTAQDGVTTRSYRLKVNVHEYTPDSLVWDKVAVSKLPSRLPSPVEQKSVALDNIVRTLILENDGTYTLATTGDIYEDEWTKEEITLPGGADVRSFTATPSAFYLLDESGNLMTSDDATVWTTTGQTWHSIIGAFGDAIIGIKGDANGLSHCHYPASADLADSPLEADFPITGYSNLCVSGNEWSDAPTGIIAGGTLSDGTLSGATWAYDGSSWVKISGRGLPPITGCTLVPYYSYKQTGTLWIQTEFQVWMTIGGLLEDGKLCRKPYLSYNNGVDWKEGDTLIELPEYIPSMTGLDNVVITTPMRYDLSDGWAGMPARRLPPYCRIAYNVTGYDVSWDCPYIYLLGGKGTDGKLYDNIWRGVLARLTFAPLF